LATECAFSWIHQWCLLTDSWKSKFSYIILSNQFNNYIAKNKHRSWSCLCLMIWGEKWFVDICRSVVHQCINFLFIKLSTDVSYFLYIFHIKLQLKDTSSEVNPCPNLLTEIEKYVIFSNYPRTIVSSMFSKSSRFKHSLKCYVDKNTTLHCALIHFVLKKYNELQSKRTFNSGFVYKWWKLG
jgi:hypothetical protein